MNFVTAGKKNACNLQIIMFYLTFYPWYIHIEVMMHALNGMMNKCNHIIFRLYPLSMILLISSTYDLKSIKMTQYCMN